MDIVNIIALPIQCSMFRVKPKTFMTLKTLNDLCKRKSSVYLPEGKKLEMCEILPAGYFKLRAKCFSFSVIENILAASLCIISFDKNT